MQPSTIESLRDILTEAEFVATQVIQTTFETFVRDEVKKRAFVRSLEVIVNGGGDISALTQPSPRGRGR